MYSRLQIAIKYLNYYLSAANGRGHGIHSPFVFNFVTKVLNDNSVPLAYSSVESLRQRLMNETSSLEVEDRGAGSGILKKRRRKIADIVRTAAKPKKFGQLLFRIARYYDSRCILELGTSLGITTSYLALANPKGRVLTIEGSQEVARQAKNNFEELAHKNVELTEGDFDIALPEILKAIQQVDLVFIDGNHRKEPTLRYFSMLLEKAHPASVFIFDDIHWSREMEESWEIIRSHASVTCSIDLFFIGLVFFRSEIKTKQHFVIRF